MPADLDPTKHRAAYDTLMVSLQADLKVWTAAPTVPDGFDPARPYVVTPGGGLTVRTGPEGLEVVDLEPGNLVEYSVIPLWGQHLERNLRPPWRLVPVTAIREERIESLTGAIEHLKGYAPPDVT